MTFSLEDDSKIVLAFVTTVLFFKIAVTLSKQGAAAKRPPEDKGMSLSQDDEERQMLTSSDEEDAESQQPRIVNSTSRQQKLRRRKQRYDKRERWSRIVMNDIENIPLGLLILWVNPMCSANGIVTSVCAMVFAVCRVLHTIFYAYELQPFRSIVFTMGVLSIFAACINLIIGALNE